MLLKLDAAKGCKRCTVHTKSEAVFRVQTPCSSPGSEQLQCRHGVERQKEAGAANHSAFSLGM